MTGFGRSTNRTATAQPDGGKTKKAKARREPQLELDIAVKAVNGRYLDIRFHLPREYTGLEGEFKSILAATFKRGTLDIYVNRRSSEEGAARVRVNHALAKSWLDSYRELGRALKIKAASPSLDLLTRLPEVFSVEEMAEIAEAEVALAKKILGDAAAACDQERKREGKALADELERLCARLEEIGEEAQALKEEAKAELENRTLGRLREHLKKLGFDGKFDEQRIAQEIVITLDRVDIAEELQRLREHLRAYRKLLKSSESEGKKLDFYAQELLREINTIGSKSHIASLTSLVVEAKTLVERIREQVQNVE